jgi:phosphoribosylglycinamide formyltransferase-1
MKNLAILASHNGSGFDSIYEAVLNKELNVNIQVVISNNTNAVVLQKAQKFKLNNFLVNSKTDENPDEKIYELLKELKCEYIFLSGYMKKLSSKITENFYVINSHPSLLPHYGGSVMYGRFVHEAVIRDKQKISGVTIHEVNTLYDEGKILYQQSLSLEEKESVESLELKIKELEKEVIIKGLQICLK